MLFTGSKAWSDDYMGPAMMAPPLFCMLLLLTAFAMLVLYCCMDRWHQRQASYQALPQAVKPDKEEVPYNSAQFEVFRIDDSANETSDGGLLLTKLAIIVSPDAISSHYIHPFN